MRRLSLLALGLVLGAAFIGCDNQGELPARVRVVHVAPGIESLDLLIDFDVTAQNLRRGEASTYVTAAPGLSLLTARIFDEDGIEVTVERQVILEEDRDYTVVVASFTDAGGLVVLEDDRSTIAFGRARLRALHADPESGALDVAVRPRSSAVPVVEAAGLLLGDATAPTIIEEGEYDVLVENGTGDVFAQTIEERRSYLFVIVHAGAGTGRALVPIVED